MFLGKNFRRAPPNERKGARDLDEMGGTVPNPTQQRIRNVARRAETDGALPLRVPSRQLTLCSSGGLAFGCVQNTSNDACGHRFEAEWLHGIGCSAFRQR